MDSKTEFKKYRKGIKGESCGSLSQQPKHMLFMNTNYRRELIVGALSLNGGQSLVGSPQGLHWRLDTGGFPRASGLSVAVAPGLCTGSTAVAHRLSSSAACGTLPDQGLNSCLLHWQTDSSPLSHQGS